MALLSEALEVDRYGETKYLLVNRAGALELLGDYHGAIAALRQAEPLYRRKSGAAIAVRLAIQSPQ